MAYEQNIPMGGGVSPGGAPSELDPNDSDLTDFLHELIRRRQAGRFQAGQALEEQIRATNKSMRRGAGQ